MRSITHGGFMCFAVELQDKVATLESEAAVLYKYKSKTPFLEGRVI